MRAILVQSAHAAGGTTDTYLRAQYRRFARRRGKKQAAVVVAHNSILDTLDFILRDQVSYQELGPNYLDELNKTHLVRYHLCWRLESLGLNVQIQEAQPAPATSSACSLSLPTTDS